MVDSDSRATEKLLLCLGDTLHVLRQLPMAVRRSFGYSLSALQMRETPVGDIKKFEGLRGVFEIRKNFGDTYRLVYCAAFGDALFILHVFKKKSPDGVRTAKSDAKLIRTRYAEARNLADKL